ncbi:MAG: GAF domain-containing protein [Desulfobacterales bacterium]|nr:GAF domain-containing protein [Desulfobacterales bacterium]
MVIISPRLHRYLLPLPPVERRGEQYMRQSARILPLHRDGRVIGTLTLIEDVSERFLREGELRQHIHRLQDTEKALRRQERQFRTLVEANQDLVLVLEDNGDIRYLSPSVVSLLGDQPELHIARRLPGLIHPQDRPAVIEIFREVRHAVNQAQTREFRLRGQEGDWRMIEATFQNLAGHAEDGGIAVYGRDITERHQAKESLRHTQEILAIRNRVAEVFLTIPDDEMYAEVLAIILEAMNSEYGVFGYLDEKGGLVVPTMTRTIWHKCQVADKRFIFPRETWGNSSWSQALREKQTICLNGPSTLTPEGHVAVTRHISLPIIHQDEVVGLIQVADKKTDYTAEDIALLESIGGAIAPVLDARLKGERQKEARQQAEETLRLREAKLTSIFRAAPTGIGVSVNRIITEVNDQVCQLTGYNHEELLGESARIFYSSDEDFETTRNDLYRMIRETGVATLETRWRRKDGTIIDLLLSSAPMVPGDLASGITFTALNITEHKQAEAKIKELNALLRAIKEINEALLRVKSEPDLFQQICELLVQVPNIRFTWVGLVQPESFEIKPVAWAGYEAGYLSDLRVTWDDSPHGGGAIGSAIKTGQLVVMEDIAGDPSAIPWREAALKRGYRYMMALPLVHGDLIIGALNVYSEKQNVFGKDEIEFLQQVAGDIAVGVRSLRVEQEMVAGLIKLQVMMIQTIEAIASMAELRDPYTAGHQQRVTRLALALAQETGLAPDRTEGLRVASLIHDIGKIVVPAEILILITCQT